MRSATLAGLNDIQELSKTHEIVSKAKTELWDRLLTHYLPLYFPEVARFAGNSRSDWFLAFLERFPTPASRADLGQEGFLEAAWPVIGRKVSKARLLNDIYQTACSSIGFVELEIPAVAMFRMVIAEGRSLIRQRDMIEAQAHALLGSHPDCQRLRQLPGIGPINAMTILLKPATCAGLLTIAGFSNTAVSISPRISPVSPRPDQALEVR